VDQQKLALMFYSCAQEKPDTVFQVFPSSEVDVRAAAVYARTKRSGARDDFCLVAFLDPEEEGSAYQEVLQSTLQRVITAGGDASERGRQCHNILADTFRRIRRRGGSRERALCPYTYDRPVDEEFVSYCRVVKKPCYLRIYSMVGFPQCPRYVRKQRRTQLANARRIVRAGIQRILDDADEKRQLPKGRSTEAWIEPVGAILDRLFAVLPVSEETSTLSRRIVNEIRQKGVFQGHPRPIVAASIACLAAKLTGDKVPENDIIELVGCSRTSLRRNYRELHDYLNAGALGRNLPSTKRIRQRRRAVSRAE
jgi:hypothetical protein